MTTRKREKMIKEIVDQEFGPNLTVDEICEGIDFSQRNGVRLTDPLKKKPFFKRPLVLTLANICLILICVLSTFFITRSYSRNIGDFTKICTVLEKDELDFLEDNGYKYKNHIDQMIVIEGEINLYIIVVEKDNLKYCMVKLQNYNNDENVDLLINTQENEFLYNYSNDFENIGALNSDNEISLSINYKKVINKYTIQCNPY